MDLFGLTSDRVMTRLSVFLAQTPLRNDLKKLKSY